MEKADSGARKRNSRTDGRERPQPKHDLPATGLSESDPAFAIVSGIIGVVPASRWTFARVEPGGELVSFFGSDTNVGDRALLADEFRRQRNKSPNGPRIAAMLGSLDDFSSGVALVFADARANFGILTILRLAALGPFTSSEISILTFALDAVSEHLSALRLQPPAKDAVVFVDRLDKTLPAEREGAFYVLDAEMRIVMAWSTADERRVAANGLELAVAERLPSLLEETVRELTLAWPDEDVRQPGVARPVSFLVVRTRPMTGPTGRFIGVRVERYHEKNSLTRMVARFHISPRETQVLALLLDGNRLDQIAKRLYITSSTVQDHIKSMLDKTESRNRSELIARVLGWEFTPVSAKA